MESNIENFTSHEIIFNNAVGITKVRSTTQFSPLQSTAFSPFRKLSEIEDDTIINVQGGICFIGKTQTKISKTTGNAYDTQLIMLEDYSGNKVKYDLKVKHYCLQCNKIECYSR